MSWKERLKPAAYTAPSGIRMEWVYENVSIAFTKKTGVYDFSDVDGSYVQDQGITGSRIPCKMIFSGADYDVQAKTFSEMLAEKGIGVLEHPMYGRFNVVPFGTISRRDDLKSAANQAIFEVTFYETKELLYPQAETEPADEVLESLRQYGDLSANGFADDLIIEDTVEAVSLREQLAVLLANAKIELTPIAAQSTQVLAEFETVMGAVEADLTNLRNPASATVGELSTLAFQMNRALMIPSRAPTAITERLVSYRAILDAVTSTVHTPTLDAQGVNLYYAENQFAMQAQASAVASTLNADFTVRTNVILAAEELLSMHSDLTAWEDTNIASLGIVDPGGAYRKLHEATVTAAGFLVAISFTLKQERSLVLLEPRTIIDLCAELYGNVDEDLDFLLLSNNLVGEEIIEVPMGRRVVFYQ